MIEIDRRFYGTGVHGTSNRLDASATVNLRGAIISKLTESECVSLILDELDAGHGGWLITMNLDHLRRFEQDPAYASLVHRASLLIADGMPLIWASRLQGTPLPERITGSNLIWSLTQAAEQRRSIFLLGGTIYANARTAQVLKQRFPLLNIAGAFCPTVGFEHNAVELERLTRAVTSAQPDIVYVALGSPKEDDLIEYLHEQMPRAWLIGVGISFSFVSGEIARAPIWVQRTGLEWLHRLVQEPQRLYRRYLFQGIPFAGVLLGDALYERVRKVTRNYEDSYIAK
jgi:N-acetylglucosaminyldiphosphoundecaprenol N-acetyl-beta-D-mannosaminyltransferase